MKNIIAIGSHYDDIEIGCSGTLFKHSYNHDNIHLIITHSDIDLTGEPIERNKEQLNAIKLLDICNNIKLKTFNSTDNLEIIVKYIDSCNANIIFVPWECDTHQDHRKTSIIGQAGGRKRHIQTLFYSGASTYNFNPIIFNPIDFVIKTKILHCFSSQIECGAINPDIIEKREAYWASIISENIDYAEAFTARKMRYSYVY